MLLVKFAPVRNDCIQERHLWTTGRIDRTIVEEIASVSFIYIEKIEFIDHLAFHHSSLVADFGGNITDIGLISSDSVLICYPLGLKFAFVFAYNIPVACKVAGNSICKVAD